MCDLVKIPNRLVGRGFGNLTRLAGAQTVTDGRARPFFSLLQF